MKCKGVQRICLRFISGWFNSQLLRFRFKISEFLVNVVRKGGYFAFLKSIVPSGAVVTNMKSCANSCLALLVFVVPSTIHSPLVPASRCIYF